jgi:hypothetical protein
MIQWVLKKFLYIMGAVYVFLDMFVKYPVDVIADVKIDKDLQTFNRYQLCKDMELIFGLKEDVFWELPSTSKIRLGCQLTRNVISESNLKIYDVKRIKKQP